MLPGTKKVLQVSSPAEMWFYTLTVVQNWIQARLQNFVQKVENIMFKYALGQLCKQYQIKINQVRWIYVYENICLFGLFS